MIARLVFCFRFNAFPAQNFLSSRRLTRPETPRRTKGEHTVQRTRGKQFNALFFKKSFELIKLHGWGNEREREKGKPIGDRGEFSERNNHLIIFHCVKPCSFVGSGRDIRCFARKKREKKFLRLDIYWFHLPHTIRLRLTDIEGGLPGKGYHICIHFPIFPKMCLEIKRGKQQKGRIITCSETVATELKGSSSSRADLHISLLSAELWWCIKITKSDAESTARGEIFRIRRQNLFVSAFIRKTNASFALHHSSFRFLELRTERFREDWTLPSSGVSPSPGATNRQALTPNCFIIRLAIGIFVLLTRLRFAFPVGKFRSVTDPDEWRILDHNSSTTRVTECFNEDQFLGLGNWRYKCS